MARRKTVGIKELIELVNGRNRESVCSADTRDGWNSVLEQVMMDANVYVGFGYLKSSEVPEGQEPGVVWLNEKPYFHDETRRFYYIHDSLKG